MAKFVLFLICLTVIHTCFALKCKECQDCASNQEKDGDCPKPPETSESGCLIEVYKGTDNKEVKRKGCVNIPKGQKYSCPKQTGLEITKCDTCQTDLCNSAQSVQLVGYIGMILACLVSRYIIN